MASNSVPGVRSLHEHSRMFFLFLHIGSDWLLLLPLLHVVSVCAGVLMPRDTTLAVPIQFKPDQNWEGIDGSWNSFTLRVGTPSSTVRVFPSWMSYQTWVIAAQGCMYYNDISACENARGGVFNYTESSTFDEVGVYSTWIERNLGYDGNAQYGMDTVTLGGIGEGGPTLSNTTVGAVAWESFYLGVFGLNPKPTNWTSYEDSSPSYMTQLKEQKLIPSVSFGYTAGAPYRFTGVLASLTLGGYDSARFTAPNFEFTFAADNERDTVVAIQSITTPSEDDPSTSTSLLPTPIYALIDTTVPQIWLPLEACQKFEDEFGLIYDNTTDLYLVNSTLHASLLQRGANVTFNLAQATEGGSISSISLPYSAFDLTAQPPYQGLANSTTYFPLRRAQNDTQYTLGRTFMQEAYISVDYERARFNISQCVWVQNAEANLVPIYPANTGENAHYSGAGGAHGKSSSISGGVIGGIVAAVVVILAAITGMMFWFLRRRSKAKAAAAVKASQNSSRDSTISSSQTMINEKPTAVFPKAELEGSNMHPETAKLLPPDMPTTPLENSTLGGYGSHMSGSTQSNSLITPLSPGAYSEAGGDQVFEMPGDMPEVSQADGRQISEKDMMRRREVVYNGADPHASQESQVTVGAEQPEPRRLVQPEEVVLHSGVQDEHQPGLNHDRFSFEDGSTAGRTL